MYISLWSEKYNYFLFLLSNLLNTLNSWKYGIFFLCLYCFWLLSCLAITAVKNIFFLSVKYEKLYNKQSFLPHEAETEDSRWDKKPEAYWYSLSDHKTALFISTQGKKRLIMHISTLVTHFFKVAISGCRWKPDVNFHYLCHMPLEKSFILPLHEHLYNLNSRYQGKYKIKQTRRLQISQQRMNHFYNTFKQCFAFFFLLWRLVSGKKKKEKKRNLKRLFMCFWFDTYITWWNSHNFFFLVNAVSRPYS